MFLVSRFDSILLMTGIMGVIYENGKGVTRGGLLGFGVLAIKTMLLFQNLYSVSISLPRLLNLMLHVLVSTGNIYMNAT